MAPDSGATTCINGVYSQDASKEQQPAAIFNHVKPAGLEDQPDHNRRTSTRSSLETSSNNGDDDETTSDGSESDEPLYDVELETHSESESQSKMKLNASLISSTLKRKTGPEQIYPTPRVIEKYAKVDQFFNRDSRISLRHTTMKRALANAKWMFDPDTPVMSRPDYEQWAKQSLGGRNSSSERTNFGESLSLRDVQGCKLDYEAEDRKKPSSNRSVPVLPQPLGYEIKDFMTFEEMLSLLAPEDYENLKDLVEHSDAVKALQQGTSKVDMEFWKEVLQMQATAAMPATNVDQEITPNEQLIYEHVSEAQLPWALHGISIVNQEERRRMPPQRLGRISGWCQRQSTVSLFGVHDKLSSDLNEGPPDTIPTGAPKAIVEIPETLVSNPATKSLHYARSPIHNWGLFAGQPIKKGEFIIEYVGESKPLFAAEYQNTRYLQEGTDSNYMFALDDKRMLDATRRGSISRLMNHCCTPNCAAKAYYLGKTRRMGLYALRNIRPFEELTFDYKFEREEGEDRVLCLCGSSKCRIYLA